MRLGPFDITLVKQAGTSVVSDRRGSWWPLVRERYTGAWQRNDEWSVDTVISFHAVYACVTLIASDIGKLRTKLVEQDSNGIWTEIDSAAFSPVLRRPNRYQNHIQFKEWWITSKLLRGNAYALKERDMRGIVRALYLLDPSRVTVLVAPDGAVYYKLATDTLSGIGETDGVTVPASEIIHDRMNCLFHPLIGTSPIFACGSAAHIGKNIERNSSNFFANGSVVSGQLLVPTAIPQDKADELRERWKAKFDPENPASAGTIAVLSGGMKFEPLQMTAVDAQLIDQLHFSAQAVATAFHVPGFKIGVKDPTYNSAEMANTIYYSDCLQSHIEQFELVMDEGLGIGVGQKIEGKTYGVELDLDGLLRMDTAAQVTALTNAIGGSLLSVNGARKRFGEPPVPGGNSIYMQQQNYSLEALAERDRNSPLLQPTQPQLALPPGRSEEEEDDEEEIERALDAAFQTIEKELAA